MTPKEAKRFRNACKIIRQHIGSDDIKSQKDFESVVQRIVITNLWGLETP